MHKERTVAVPTHINLPEEEADGEPVCVLKIDDGEGALGIGWILQYEVTCVEISIAQTEGLLREVRCRRDEWRVLVAQKSQL